MPAMNKSLERLEEFLRSIGFKVVKKTAREKTLRVYPTKIWQYPLLNPRFGRDFLTIHVWSKGDRRALDRYLNRNPAFHPCGGFDPTRNPEEYNWHGYFQFPVRFRDKRADFESLLRFLERAPVNNPN